MISCILLSAGLSERFGSPKALASTNNQTVIEIIQKTLLQTMVCEIIVVLGYKEKDIRKHIIEDNRVRVMINEQYELGQTSSFKVGLEGVSSQSEGIMLLPVDYPAASVQTINQIIDLFEKKKPLIVVPCFEQKKGHPPIFHARLKEEFEQLDNSMGINTILHRNQNEVCCLAVNDSGVIKSFNTKEEWARIEPDLH